MKIIDGGVTAAKGFEAAAAEAQIKYKDRKDMALIYSQAPMWRRELLQRMWSRRRRSNGTRRL